MSRLGNKATRRGILLFSNRRYLFALGTFLINLQKNVSYDGVIVYHDGFTAEEQEAIRKVEPNVDFIKYGLDEFAKEFGFDKKELSSKFFIQRYTVLTVIKFKIFQHLNEFSTMMLFDLDMLLLDGIDELLEKDFDIAWKSDVQTIRDKLNNWKFSDEHIRQINMYDLYSKTITPNGGFVIVKRNFDHQAVYNECVNYLKKYSFAHPYSIDEIMFGYIRARMNLKPLYVDGGIYNVFPAHASRKTKLIHFLGDYKPWNKQTVQTVFRDWWTNYESYLAITNMPSEEVRDYHNVSECLLRAYYSEKWNDLFDKHKFLYPQELKLKPDLSRSVLTLSYHGVLDYKIEINWLTPVCNCSVWVEKNNKSLPIEDIQAGFKELAAYNSGFLSYHEDNDRFALKTTGKLLWEVPETFYHLYDMTAELRKVNMSEYVKMSTYHGTGLYVDFEKRCLVHSKEGRGAEVYACINGGRIALFISMSGMNIYVKDMGSNGAVSMTSHQTFFSCVHNPDHSVSIEMKDGNMLSADRKGRMVLRHWNREWEHFSTQKLLSIME